MAEKEAAGEAWAAFTKHDITGLELVTRLGHIYNRDFCKEQADRILEVCTPYQVTGHDTPGEVGAFLSDFQALEGRVATSFPPPPSMRKYFNCTTEPGTFATIVGSLLVRIRSRGDFSAFKAVKFLEIWDVLREFAKRPMKLDYITTKNMPLPLAESTRNPWKFFFNGSRPDNIVMCRRMIHLFGVEKENAACFETAKGELTEKLVGLPAALYGKLKFVICYAAAGPLIQFYVLSLRVMDNAPVVLTPVTEILDATVDFPHLILLYIKLYFLLLGMDASVASAPRFPLGTFINHGYSEVMLTLDGAVKKISDFDAYSSKYNVDISDLKAAYAAAAKAGGYMISSVLGPRVEVKEADVVEGDFSSRSPSGSGSLKRSSTSSQGSDSRKKGRVSKTKEVYEVETVPLCSEKVPETEDDLREMVYGVLQGLKALHDAGLVHRDIRLANIMYDYSENKYVLIDLESVAEDGVEPAFRLKSWNGGTLDNGTYTKQSDFHQLGLVLKSAKNIQPISTACKEFMTGLLSKNPECSAESLLKNKWLSQLSGTSILKQQKWCLDE